MYWVLILLAAIAAAGAVSFGFIVYLDRVDPLDGMPGSYYDDGHADDSHTDDSHTDDP